MQRIASFGKCALSIFMLTLVGTGLIARPTLVFSAESLRDTASDRLDRSLDRDGPPKFEKKSFERDLKVGCSFELKPTNCPAGKAPVCKSGGSWSCGNL